VRKLGRRLAVGVVRLAEPLTGRVLGAKPIRDRLWRRAMRAWRATDAPLILCFGNINRSPFAAHLARRRPGSVATSAGFFPSAGRASPAATLACAARHGVALEGHRSAIATAAMLRSAPAIFVFDLQNVVQVASRCPRALSRVHLLATLSAEGPVFISDPHGRPEAELQRAFEAISRAVAEADAEAG
jgi:protein-tyrosine-phosphatase